MRKSLQLVAFLVAAISMSWWGLAGANTGWTKTQVPHSVADPVTGLQGITYERRFVPGLDFLVATDFGCVLLFAASFLFRKPTH